MKQRLARLLLFAFINFLGTTAYFFLPIYLTQHLGLTTEMSGLIVSSRGFAALVASLFAGYFLDRFGVLRTANLSLALSAFSQAAIIFFHSPIFIIVCVAIFSGARTVFRPLYNIRQSECVEPKDLARSYSLFLVFTNLGIGVASIIGAVLYMVSPVTLFLFDASLALVGALLAKSMLGAGPAPLEHFKVKQRNSPPALGRSFQYVCLNIFIFEVFKNQMLFQIPISFNRSDCCSSLGWGVMTSIASFATIVLSYPAASFTQGYCARKVVSISTLISLSGLAATEVFDDTTAKLAFWLVFCIGQTLYYPASMRLAILSSDGPLTGKTSGTYYASALCGAFVGPALAGLTIASLNAWALILECGVLSVACLLMILVSSRSKSVDE